jgi:hypothetical protein
MGEQSQESKELPAFENAADELFELEVFVDLCWAGMAYAGLYHVAITRLWSILEAYATESGVCARVR